MKIFLSSVYMDSPSPGDENHLSIRKRLYQFGEGRADLEIWVAEYFRKRLRDAPWFEIADTCVDNLRDSDAVMVLLYRRGGNPIWLNEAYGSAQASYLELELVHASILAKPVFFFTIDGYEPEPALVQLIDIIRRSTTARQWRRGSEHDVELLIEDMISHMGAVRAANLTVNRFIDSMSDERSFANTEREISSTRISFLHGLEPIDVSDFSLPRVDMLLASLREAGPNHATTMPARLNRIWLAMRELAKVKTDDIDGEIAQRWDTASSAWPSPAAWLKAHGPLRAGVLAGLQTQQELRLRGLLGKGAFPFGAYASEAYSIAKLSKTRRWRGRRLKAAIKLAHEQAKAHPEDISGALAIKASATLQLARLGRPWLVFDALADYRTALEDRQKHGARDSAVGEAMSEWAFAEYQVSRILFWRRRQALDRLAEGVRLMEADDPAGRAGFVIRAKDKFAAALKAEGQNEAAEVQKKGADDLARDAGLPRTSISA